MKGEGTGIEKKTMFNMSCHDDNLYSVAANHLAISVSKFVRTNLQRKRYCLLVHACGTNSQIQCHPRSTEIVLFLCCSIILCHV